MPTISPVLSFFPSVFWSAEPEPPVVEEVLDPALGLSPDLEPAVVESEEELVPVAVVGAEPVRCSFPVSALPSTPFSTPLQRLRRSISVFPAESGQANVP